MRENLTFFGRVLGLRGAQLADGVEQALRVTDLAGRAGERAGVLSGGLQRRLSFGCAIVHTPALLLLDEPTVGVDSESRSLIYDGLEALKRRGTTILCATHMADEAARLADRVVMMAAGKITAEHATQRSSEGC